MSSTLLRSLLHIMENWHFRIAAIATLAVGLTLVGCAGEKGTEPVAAGGPDAVGVPISDQPSQGNTGLPTGARRLDRAVILDSGGFERPMVAGTLFVPHGWQTEGGVVWGNEYACTNGYALSWQARSPSGEEGMAFLPQRGWGWNSSGAANGSCPTAQIDSAAAYLDQVLPNLLERYQVVARRQRPDLAAQAQVSAGVQDTGFQRTTVSVDAADVLVAYQEEGRLMSGRVAALVTFTHIRTGGAAYGVVTENVNAFAGPVFVSYGEADRYDSRFFEGLARSLIVEPGWETRITQHNLTMGRIEREGIMARSRIHSQAIQEISELNQRAWEAQQKSSDRRAREFVEYIRDVETYRDAEAPGGTVELNSAYDHAWRLADGSYVLTTDPSFDPYAALGIEGKKLGAAQ